MLRSTQSQNLPVTRISLIDTQRRLCQAIAGAPLRKLIVLPDRPNRFERRVRKRRPKQYPWMKKTHHKLKQELANEDLTTSVSAIRNIPFSETGCVQADGSGRSVTDPLAQVSGNCRTPGMLPNCRSRRFAFP